MKNKAALEAFHELLEIVETLRGPEGCPWDKKQTHFTLVPFLLEEAYEAVSVIDSNEINKLPEELGDVLLQVILHAQIGKENQEFDIVTVIHSICKKLIRRHPHVFGDVSLSSSEEVIKQWQSIKQMEDNNKDPFQNIPKTLPPILEAQKCQEKAAQFGFDWMETNDVIIKVKEELNELLFEISIDDQEKIENELGDVFFALINLARFVNVNPLNALRKANAKFKKRFNYMISLLENPNEMKKMSLSELDELWNKAKNNENHLN